MATATTYYDLKKPASSDFYDIADFNNNMDAIDQALHDNETPIQRDTQSRTHTARGTNNSNNILSYDWIKLPGFLMIHFVVTQSDDYDHYHLDLPTPWQKVQGFNQSGTNGFINVTSIKMDGTIDQYEAFEACYGVISNYGPYLGVNRYTSDPDVVGASAEGESTIFVPILDD